MLNRMTAIGNVNGSIKRSVRAALCVGALLSLSPLAASAISVTQDGADYTVTVEDVGGFVYDVTYLADFTSFANANRPYVSGINFKFSNGPDLVSALLLSAPGGASLWSTTINDNLKGGNAAIGCDGGNGGTGFVCSGITLAANYGIAPTLPNDPAAGPIYEWVVQITLKNALTPAMITNTGNPIRAQFIKYECKTSGGGGGGGNTNKTKKTSTPATETCEWTGTGQMSLNGPFVDCTDGKCEPPEEQQVPEPGTLALLGLGLLGLAAVRRKKIA